MKSRINILLLLTCFVLLSVYSTQGAFLSSSLKQEDNFEVESDKPVQWHCNLANLDTCAACACYYGHVFKDWGSNVRNLCLQEYGQLWKLQTRCGRYIWSANKTKPVSERFKTETLITDMYVTSTSCILRPSSVSSESTTRFNSDERLPVSQRFLPIIFGVAARVALIVARQAARAAIRAAARAANAARKAKRAADLAKQRKKIEDAIKAARQVFKQTIDKLKKQLPKILKKIKELAKDELETVVECMEDKLITFPSDVVDDKKLVENLGECLKQTNTVCIASLFVDTQTKEMDGEQVLNGLENCVADDLLSSCIDRSKDKFKKSRQDIRKKKEEKKKQKRDNLFDKIEKCVPGFLECSIIELEFKQSDDPANDTEEEEEEDQTLETIQPCIAELVKDVSEESCVDAATTAFLKPTNDEDEKKAKTDFSNELAKCIPQFQLCVAQGISLLTEDDESIENIPKQIATCIFNAV